MIAPLLSNIYKVVVLNRLQGGLYKKQMKIRSLLETKKSEEMNKKGQVAGLSGDIVSLGVAAIVLVLVIVIVQELRDTQATTTDAWGAANKTLFGLGQFGDFWVIIVLAVVAAVVIGVIFGLFSRAGRR